MATSGTQHIVLVGGGYIGMYTALRLQRKLRRGEARVTVIDPQSYLTYQPFLPEAAAGSLEPRHVVVPLRRVLRRCTVLTGTVTRIEHGRRRVTMQPMDGPPRELSYDQIVVAPGSVARTLPIPGLRERAVGFKTIEEAIYLRNWVLARLDLAATTDDPQVRRRALSFVFVGGGYAGIEAFAELQDMAAGALRYFEGIAVPDMRWVLVEATGRILPEVSRELSSYTAQRLTERGMEVHLNTRLVSCVGGQVVLDDGTEFAAQTVVWTAGVRANPVLANSDLPRDERGRLPCNPQLQVIGADDNPVAGAWSAGDCAAVPDLSQPGQLCGPSAQHAVRQARTLGDNLAAAMRGRALATYRHAYVGSVASLGLHKGVAEVYGIKLRGYPAWLMHRSYHWSRVPTVNRKFRVGLDWALALFFRRDLVSLGQLQNPRWALQSATAASAQHENGAQTS
ncbi:MAG: NAD(P)/FAD-dependent oxidoreductase [Pseudonocardiales bacterium]